MKQTETCPKCRCTKLFVVDEARRRHATEAMVTTAPVTVTAADVRLPSVGLFGEGVETRIVEAGRVEAWICAACGYTEWYTTRREELETLAATTSAVRVIDRNPRTGPYRT